MNEQQQQIEDLRAALLDIAFGAAMMMQPPLSGPITRYAAEVRRVAEGALGRPVSIDMPRVGLSLRRGT